MDLRTHTDVLDEQDSLAKPFVGSVMLHAAVAGLLVVSTISFQRSHETWGGPTHSGDAVSVNAVKSIPLPSRSGHLNPVANPTESQVPQAKPEPKKQVKVPEKAKPLKSRLAEKQPKQQALQRYRPEPLRPNQVTASDAPAAVSRMFQKPGTGQIGVGPNNALGDRFGAYADLVVQRVTEKWQTTGLAGLQTAPVVIVTFDIQRDGSVRNVQVVQRSGNSTLDFSAQRAVMDAAPFPPLPQGYERNEASVELHFQLQR
jgi:periplasmic protein TonB